MSSAVSAPAALASSSWYSSTKKSFLSTHTPVFLTSPPTIPASDNVFFTRVRSSREPLNHLGSVSTETTHAPARERGREVREFTRGREEGARRVLFRLSTDKARTCESVGEGLLRWVEVGRNVALAGARSLELGKYAAGGRGAQGRGEVGGRWEEGELFAESGRGGGCD